MPAPRLIDASSWWPATPARPSVERVADGITSTWAWSFDGETTTYTLTVANRHPTLTLPWLSIDLGPLGWEPTDFGTVEAFPGQWLRDQWNIGHPSTRQRRGAWMMTAFGKSWSFCPLGEELTPKTVVRWANVLPTSLLYFIKKPVAPGETVVTRFAIRTGTSADYRVMLEAYRRSHWLAFPTYSYATTQEPIVAAFRFADPSLITASNPRGYKAGWEMDGASLSLWMRDQVSRCRDLGCSEFVVWNAGGIYPFSDLNADFAPAHIEQAMRALCDLAKPMRVILGARIGIVNDPTAPAESAGPKQPAGIRPRRLDEIPQLEAAVDRALSWGVDTFYVDEGGMRPNDPALIDAVRNRQWRMGRIGAGFGERTAIDVMAPRIGGYTNAYPDGAGGFRFGPAITADDVAFMRWLRPGVPFVVQVRDTPPEQMEAAYRAVARIGARALVPFWDAAKWVPIWRRVAAEVRAEQVAAL